MRERYDMVRDMLPGSDPEKGFAAQRLMELMDEMPGGFFIYRADGDERLLYGNTALLRIFGCETEEQFRALTGGTFPGMVHPDDLEAVEESIRTQIESSRYDLDYVEYRIIRKDGEVRWLEDHGHFSRSKTLGDIFYVFVSDETEKIQKRRQEHDDLLNQADRQEARLRACGQESVRRQELIKGLGADYESIFYVDLDADRIHAYRLSRQTGQLFPSDPPVRDYSGFVQEYITRWVHPDDRTPLANALVPANIRGQLERRRVLHINYRFLREGREEYIQLRIVSANQELGFPQVVMGSRSVDEEIRSTLEQKEFLAAALGQAQSAVAAKNAFLSNMSHDMRTPLNAIAGFTELARRGAADTERVQRYLEMIDVSCGQLLRLINNVLEIARINSEDSELAQEPCDLRLIAGQVRSALLPHAAAKNMVLSLHTEGLAHPVVRSDSHKLEEILYHLCSNAVKYTELGGRVSVTLSEQEGRCLMVVEDNGIGISKGFQKHIFEFFAREQNTTLSGVHGTGLGLPIVKNLTEMLGGTIDVWSVPGKGSRFTVSLPLMPLHAPEQASASGQPPAWPGGEGKILVVEDNELNLEIAVELLRDAGFRVDAAENGKAAVDRIRGSQPGEYALILMDIQMPVMDGCEAARAIRSLPEPWLSSLPIVALSANTFEEDRRRALHSGMNAHMPKPIDIEPLVTLIRELTGLGCGAQQS